jgi:hypothetical protein
VRVDASSSQGGLAPVAFRNSSGRYVVVVRAATGGTFRVRGLPAGTWGINFTAGAQFNVSAADVNLQSGEDLTAAIPAAGVITLYQR